MNDTNSTASDRLGAAQDRLARAIGRLEAAADHRASPSPVSAGMDSQLDALREENAKLRALLGATSARLDDTIAKFKSKLAG